jgi:fructose-specific phosphotransferase system IIA component
VHEGGKRIGMCGEMAGELRHLPLLLGLGLDSISISPASIPNVKERISRLDSAACEALLKRVLSCRELEEVDAILEHSQPESEDRPLLDRDLVLFGVQAESKDDAIRQIIDAFYMTGRTGAPDQLEDAVWDREAVYSTGLGHGFAIPHCRTNAVFAESIGILRLRQPIDWGSLDGQAVHTVVLLASRQSDANSAHMKVFSRLARKLMDHEFRDQLLRAADAGSIVTTLRDELELAVAG